MDSNLRCGPQGSQTQMPRGTRQELSKHVNHSDLRLQEDLRPLINCWESRYTNMYAYIYKNIYEKKLKVKSLSHVRLFTNPWTIAYHTPPSMGFSRQEYWSGLSFPSPGGSFWPRDRTRVSCIVGRRFTVWATREAYHTIRLSQLSKCAVGTGINNRSADIKCPKPDQHTYLVNNLGSNLN